jgi:hypothetical protein
LSNRKIHGWLDRSRETLQILDRQIKNAERMTKNKDSRVALQWVKVLRDLLELRNETLTSIKSHLLGHATTGQVGDPADIYTSEDHATVAFEEEFQDYLTRPWTKKMLKKPEEENDEDEDDSQS